MKRRKFLKLNALSLLYSYYLLNTGGCASLFFDPENKDISKQDYFEGFNSWFKCSTRDPEESKRGIHRLYNGNNPNHYRLLHNFKTAYLKGWSPGHSYIFRSGEDMLAMMPGIVACIGRYEGKSNRAGGQFVIVQSPEPDHRNYSVEYGHLSKVHVKAGQKIKRGDPIGYGTEWADRLKIMLYSSSMYIGSQRIGYEDPDNYGVNHEFLDYADNIDCDVMDTFDSELINDKKRKQRNLVMEFAESLDIKEPYRQMGQTHIHFPRNKKKAYWSYVEDFRFLETLYHLNKDMFPKLDSEKYKLIQVDFYKNQPFLLTLPMEKK